MVENADEYRSLWRAAEQASTTADAANLLEKVNAAAADATLSAANARQLRLTVLRSLMEATRGDREAAHDGIHELLVPQCLKQYAGDLQEVLAGERARQLLHDWIEQYPDEFKVPLRAGVLSEVIRAATQSESDAALLTVAAIGFRSPPVMEIVRKLAARDDELGDAAIRVWVSLGIPGPDRESLISQVRDRMMRRTPPAMDYAVQELGDPSFLPLLEERLRRANMPDTFSLGLISRIADKRPSDLDLQGRVWTTLSTLSSADAEYRNAMLLSGNHIPYCNVQGAIPILLDWLPVVGPARYLVYNRLEECVRPAQLTAWSNPLTEASIQTIRADATSASGPPIRAMTLEHRVKVIAWETALAAGIGQCEEWLRTAVEAEQNPFAQQGVMEVAACLALGAVPDVVTRLVTERFNLTRGGEDLKFSARVAAMRLLQSAATPDAFQSLLFAGFTHEGHPLRSTANAVGELAVLLAKRDVRPVVDALIAACAEDQSLHRRLLGVSGLEELAAAGLIPPADLEALVQIASDPKLPGYARGYLVDNLAKGEEARALPELVRIVAAMARDKNSHDEARFRALQALLRVGAWRQHLPEFAAELGLREENGTFRVDHPEEFGFWQAHLLGQLALRSPPVFWSAVSDVVQGGGSEAVHQLLTTFADYWDKTMPLPGDVEAAMIQRLAKAQGPRGGETDYFGFLARLTPDALVDSHWQSTWGAWMPHLRAALASALGEVSIRVSRQRQTTAGDLLVTLMGDAAFVVRREAARQLSRRFPERFSKVIYEWGRSGQTELRRRAAEGAVWADPDDESTLDNALIRMLEADPEPSVRSAAARSRLTLRDRVWAAHALNHVLKPRRDPNEWVLGAYAYGRALAKTADDEAIESIKTFVNEREVPPNVGHWLGKVAAEAEQHWKETTQKWPEPWLPWSGKLEEVVGVVVVGTERISARLTLWMRRRSSPDETIGWGGAFSLPAGHPYTSVFSLFRDPRMTIEILERRPAEALLSSTGSDDQFIFVGTGPYPAGTE